MGTIGKLSVNSARERSIGRRWSFPPVVFAVLSLVVMVSASEVDLQLRVNDKKSDVEKECAVFLLKLRLGDSETEVPHQCQDMVRTYLEEEGLKLSIKKECASFITNGELNNIQGWMPPPECETYIANYMEKGQYEADVCVAFSAARSYLHSLTPVEGIDAVVFDIDETVLSSLPYYRIHHYGVDKFQKTLFNAYVSESKQTVIKPALSLYEELLQNKWSIFFLTGRDEEARAYTSKNLETAGYKNYTELILRQPDEEHLSAAVYKSNRRVALEEKGYRIRASIGDQWSDLEGLSTWGRKFKVPNPMYYIY
ncbi:hypothetical protein R1sor_014621 [Riccia sorocarpa]|uniref:Acid phosphatase n=1 Tax=Riccia sorocarpa TaxID=122646 RepID=A0ABD3HCI1_9MARC